MNTTRKIAAWITFIVLAAPAFAIFNDNEDTVYFNLFGLAYAWIVIKLAPKFLPDWMLSYFDDFGNSKENRNV